jgi:TRAP-type mannitol/chloroaromatic compound transport system substrate-binding protein
MSGCTEGGNAAQIQAISTGRCGQNYPQHYPQAQGGNRSARHISTGRERSLPTTATKSQLHERENSMTRTKPQSPDPDEAIRERVLSRAKAVNAEILGRLRIAADDLEAGEHRAALGALDGIEAQLTIIRSVLLLLS